MGKGEDSPATCGGAYGAFSHWLRGEGVLDGGHVAKGGNGELL